MADFDLKSIKGAELQTLATEIAKVILSDGSVLAQALASVDKRVDAVERASAEIGNAGLGERGLVPLLTSTTSESENCAATPKSVKTVYDSLNASKQNKLSTAQQSAVDSGITAAKTTSYDSHIADSNIHVTSAQKESWDAKQNAGDYSLNGHSHTVADVTDFGSSVSNLLTKHDTDVIVPYVEGVAKGITDNYTSEVTFGSTKIPTSGAVYDKLCHVVIHSSRTSTFSSTDTRLSLPGKEGISNRNGVIFLNLIFAGIGLSDTYTIEIINSSASDDVIATYPIFIPSGSSGQTLVIPFATKGGRQELYARLRRSSGIVNGTFTSQMIEMYVDAK